MLKRTLLLSTLICTGLVLFTSSAISSEKSSEQVIIYEEMQKINLSHSFKGSNTLKIDDQNTLKKIPKKSIPIK